ncbi:MAG: squalene synthase HpnC [Verrucomicrobiales bacterium]|jgi:phytoene synthase|nr:squalene synthase HpnC [Verrucomicrobiales bacterium]
MMPDPNDAYAACTAYAKAHYENFPVGLLVSAALRPHVHAVYCFARVSDDIADEGYADPRRPRPAGALSQEQRLAQLNAFRDEFRAWTTGAADGDTPYAWVFRPLLLTMAKFDLPHSLFHDLLSAFEQDIVKRRYANFAEVLDYCVRSANPIGRLVLLLHGYRDERRFVWSDHICTALQLANFWQDVAVDLVKDRIYLPQDEREKFTVSEAQLFALDATPGFRDLLKFQVRRTQEIFDQGKPLAASLRGLFSLEISLTWHGGTTILQKIRRQNYDTLTLRPKLTKWDALPLLAKALTNR